jgi:DNA-binding SARP family transcriptional activator/predicted negative regulator of RcsB-dependent stress response
MEYRVLGPLEVLAGGEPVDIGSSRQRVVLAALLLDANRVVSLDRIVDALWDNDPPVTARSQVQICVSALRRKLTAAGAAEGIVTCPPGYLIRVPERSLDAQEWELLVTDGRAAAAEGRLPDAARYLRTALGLWRGPALGGVGSTVIGVTATRLNENRLAVLEECIGLELELGLHHDVIGELAELVAANPLREGLRGQLMLALYRDGRQADALASFRAGREVLVEGLGLDPGQELRDLERAILANDPALQRAGGSIAVSSRKPYLGAMIPHQLPAAVGDFVARADALTRIHALLTPPEAPGDRARHVEVIVLSGRSGVGKTALALYAAQELCDQYPDGQLFAQLETGGAEPVSSAHVLEGFLRALGVSLSVPSGHIDGLAQTYRSRLAGRRVLVVLDAAANASQVLPLLPGSPSCAVIVTSRSRLPGLHGAHRFEIDVFDEPTGVALLTRVIGEERVSGEEDAASYLVRLCGGLPVALRIAAAKLAARPHWTIGRLVSRLEDEKRRLDELVLDEFALDDIGIRASMSLSYESLGGAAKELLRKLAILGATDFAYWVGAPLLGLDILVVMDLMEQLVEARLIDARVLEDRSVRFQLHELIRVYALERLMAEDPPAERAAALGRALGCWLFLACEAHRRVYGGDFTVLHGDADRWVLPDDVVGELLGNPLGWFRRERSALLFAILKAAQAGFSELCWDLAMTSSTHFESGPFLDDWRQSCNVALDTVRRSGNQRGEAAMLCSLGSLALAEHNLDDAVRCLEPALGLFGAVGDLHGWALAARNLAYVDRLCARYDRALARYEQSLSALRSVGDRIAEAHVLNNMAQIYLDRQQYESAEELLNQALAICCELGVRRVAAQVEHRLGELHLRRGDLEAAQVAFESVLRTVREGNDLIGETYARYGLGTLRIRREQYAEAEVDLLAALEAASQTGDRLVHGRVLLALAELHMASERGAAALDRLGEAMSVFGEVGSAVWQARVLETTGRLHEAEGRFDAAARAWRESLELIGEADPELKDSLEASLAQLGQQARPRGGRRPAGTWPEPL